MHRSDVLIKNLEENDQFTQKILKMGRNQFHFLCKKFIDNSL